MTRTSIHRRSYDCEAFDEGDGTIRVRGRLTDTRPQGLCRADGNPLVIHDMTVELVVRPPSFEISEVATEMLTRPYATCPGVLGAYQQLVGTSIARGFNRRVRELFGGPRGCSHVGALLQAMAPVAIQASWSHATLDERPEDRARDTGPADRDRQRRLNTDSCHVWAADGDQIQRLAAGRASRRPEWEVARLRELGLAVEEAR